jgi:hypothetical protein
LTPISGSNKVVSSGGDLMNPFGLAYVASPEPSSLFFAATAGLALLRYGVHRRLRLVHQ